MTARRYTKREIALLEDFATKQAPDSKVHRLLATIRACAAERDAALALVDASWQVIRDAGRKDWTNESPQWRDLAEAWCTRYQQFVKDRKEAE